MRMFCVTLFFFVLLAPPLSAQTPIEITGWANWTSGGTAETLDRSDLQFDSETGYGISVNAFWSRRLSTELMWSTFEREAILNDNPRIALGTLKVAPITALVQYHFAPQSWSDPHIGVGAAYGQFDPLESGELESLGVTRIEIDNEIGYAVGAGVRFRIGSRWGGNVDARYFSFTPAGSSEGLPLELEIQPLVWSAGVSYRF